MTAASVKTRWKVTLRDQHGNVKYDGPPVFNTITDNGLGFDPAIIDTAEGKHIGIRNVRERLEKQCGGWLKIESRPGEGTRVTLFIPGAIRNDENAQQGGGAR